MWRALVLLLIIRRINWHWPLRWTNPSFCSELNWKTQTIRLKVNYINKILAKLPFYIEKSLNWFEHVNISFRKRIPKIKFHFLCIIPCKMLSKLCVKGLRIHLYSSLYLGLNCLCLEPAAEGILKTRCS